MRKLLIISIVSFCSNARSQSYIPLPMDSAWWQVTTSGTWASGGQCFCSYDFQYQTAGDTLIGSYNYTKIIHNGPMSCQCGMGTLKFGFIRQDTLARKVYVIEWGTTNELLLYDFTLQVNDTINSALFLWSYPCPSPITVSSIDSILINGIYHRRINFNNTTSNPCYLGSGMYAFIEGVGSTSGLLEYSFSFEAGSQLTCSAYAGQTIFSNIGTACPKMKIDKVQRESFMVFPNPSSSALQIQSSSHIDAISITDILGYEVNSKFPNSSVDVSALQDGIYFLTITSGKETHTQKFIVNH